MNDLSAVDLELLRRFVAVARTHSFRRAALELGMSQPPLTRSIQQLEASFGTMLLDRDSRGVHLTASGRVLLEQAPSLLSHAERVFRVTQASPDVRRLNIGFSGFVDPLLTALSSFRSTWPGCELHLTQLPTAAQNLRLSNGSLDVCFTFNPVDAQPDFQVEVLEALPIALAVPAQWPLARKTVLRLSDLKDVPFITSSRESNPRRRELLDARCLAVGFMPHIVHECAQMSDILKLVSIGFGVALVSEQAATSGVHGVKCQSLEDDLSELRLQLSMVWVSQHASQIQQHFIQSMRSSFQSRQHPPPLSEHA